MNHPMKSPLELQQLVLQQLVLQQLVERQELLEEEVEEVEGAQQQLAQLEVEVEVEEAARQQLVLLVVEEVAAQRVRCLQRRLVQVVHLPRPSSPLEHQWQGWCQLQVKEFRYQLCR